MTDLLTGTVVYLMSDIEGSTRLVGRLGGAFPRLLDEHFALLAEAISDDGGRLVSNEGDSVFAVFPSARQAIAAAVATQRAVAGHSWPGGAEVRVRMGIHAGEAMLGGRDYTGIDVHRTARIMAAGHGGQVLVSEAARSLASGALPDGVSFRDLGAHALRDPPAPERLYQLEAPGVTADFPPPRTQSLAEQSNLPRPLTRFVGRTREMTALRALLEAQRLVTLTGPGGTGKTRLAIELARTVVERFPDGVCFVALDVVRDPALVLPTIATTLGLPEQPGRPIAAVVQEYLAPRRQLLVLDNFEQVADAATEIAALLQAAPGLVVLVSSREPLAVAGEHVFPVPPLAVPPEPGLPAAAQIADLDAVVLFVERARAARAGFALTDANAPAVAAIARRLDGLPLAIELAAARANLLAPEQILERLDHRLTLLASTRRDLPDRQRTLRGAIDWSHDLLSEPERALFRRIAVFAGGADLDMLQSVVDPDGELEVDLLDVAGGLIDRSLLRSVQGPASSRLVMLETIREYATERLAASSEERAIRGRHACAFHALAEASANVLTDPRRDELLDRLDLELPNLRAAISWGAETGDHETALRLVTALHSYWHTRNHLTEARQALDTLLAASAGDGATPVRARALSAAAELASWQTDYALTLELASQSIAMGEAVGDWLAVAYGTGTLGWATVVSAPEVARSRFERSVAMARAIGDMAILTSSLQGMALTSVHLRDLGPARRHAEEARAIAAETGDRYIDSMTGLSLGFIDVLEGDRASGVVRFRLALEGSQQAGANIGMALALDALANVALDAGDAGTGIRLAAVAERLRSEVGGGPGVDLAGWQAPLARAAETLDPALVERFIAEGRALSTEAAIALAREVDAGS